MIFLKGGCSFIVMAPNLSDFSGSQTKLHPEFQLFAKNTIAKGLK